MWLGSSCEMNALKSSCYGLSQADCALSGQCTVLSLCYSSCTVCDTCVAYLYSEVASKATGLSTAAASALFQAACEKRFSRTACTRVAGNIMLSQGGQLARRAGALCNALQMCSTQSSCRIRSASSTSSSTTVAMDFW